MAVKLTEHTYGTHVFMRVQLDGGQVEEISAYIREKGWSYRTSADHLPEIRARIIQAFHDLY